MSFLGPVTRLDGRLVRPHDIDIATSPEPGTVEATVNRIVHLGFEVRVELQARSAAEDPEDVWVQVTRGTAEGLRLRTGDTVHLRAIPSALSLTV
ncbi:TOBE-like domain-containing protein [Hamadaea tsunoensis]|uniref:TOBE-like domain-containing protein n=1 Tax=Hamadaea tsunoensis TaxID=53368 RepID=UPI00389946CC